MNSSRYSINWISAALSALLIIIYLFAPFYSLSAVGFSLSGFSLISLNTVAILPVALGIIMAIGSCLFPPVAAVIVESITTISMLAFMFLGNTLAASIISIGLDLPSEWIAPLNTVMNVTSSIHPSWGSIICVGLCIAALIVDILSNLATHEQSKPFVINTGDDIFSGSNSDDPFGKNLF